MNDYTGHSAGSSRRHLSRDRNLNPLALHHNLNF
jgi:hypothetical protein